MWEITNGEFIAALARVVRARAQEGAHKGRDSRTLAQGGKAGNLGEPDSKLDNLGMCSKVDKDSDTVHGAALVGGREPGPPVTQARDAASAEKKSAEIGEEFAPVSTEGGEVA